MKRIDIKLLMRKKDEALVQKGEILDQAVNDNRELTAAERGKMNTFQRTVDSYEEQIMEAQEIERQRAGIPSGQPKPTMQTGDLSPGLIIPGSRAENFGFLETGYQTAHSNFGQFVQDCRWADFRDNRGFQMNIGAEGGYWVPEQFIKDVLMPTPENSIVRVRATVLPANIDAPDSKVGIPALDSEEGGYMGGVKLYWLAEGGEKPEISAKLYLITLEPHEMAAHTIVTDKLLRNDAGAASAFLERIFRIAVFDEEDYQFLCGDGVGKPLGILSSKCKIEVLRNTTSTFKFADVAAMLSKFTYDSWGRGVWVINASVLPQLIMMVDEGNHRVYVGADPSKGLPPTIPTVFTGRTPILGSLGDVMLCDFSYYLIRTGSGPFVQASEHFKFTENKTVVRTFYNVDGSPWLKAPITLRDGITKVSPFVILK
ncbi:hypothetical protein ES708_11109 [subsurface metagenome]